MQMRWCCDVDGIDTLGDQLIKRCKGAAAGELGGAGTMRGQGIDDPDHCHIRQTDQHAGMIAAHDAGADNANAKRAFGCGIPARCGSCGTHIINLDRLSAFRREYPGGSPSTSPQMWRMPWNAPGHVLSQKITHRLSQSAAAF